MTGWAYAIALAAWPGAVLSWLFMMVPGFRFAMEFRRAKRAGEIFPMGAGLPIFTKNVLPRVERDRQRVVRATVAFAGFIIAGFVAATFWQAKL